MYKNTFCNGFNSKIKLYKSFIYFVNYYIFILEMLQILYVFNEFVEWMCVCVLTDKLHAKFENESVYTHKHML